MSLVCYALHWAVDDIESMQMILTTTEEVAINEADIYGLTALHWAVDDQIVNALLAAGANVHATNYERRTSLHLAAQKGNVAAALALLTGGATVDEKDNERCTSLHLAAQDGYIKTVHALLAAGAKANAKDNNGFTPLHFVEMYSPNADFVEALEQSQHSNRLHHSTVILRKPGFSLLPMMIYLLFRHYLQQESTLIDKMNSAILLYIWRFLQV